MSVRMFLSGSAMRDGPLHHHLHGAPLLGAARTAPRYRFYAVRDEFPALMPMAAGGASITGELYELSEELLRDSLLPAEPEELELGLITLEDGTAAFAMLLRPDHRNRDDLTDITSHGGWRAYLASR